MKNIFFVLVCIICILISGCNKDVSNVEENEYNYLIAETGEINVPLTPFESLDPLTIENMSYFYLTGLVYEGLFTLDENLRPKVMLASSYELNEKKMKIRIRDGITFHDGTRLTAEDVKYSLEHIKKSMKGAYYSLIVNSITKEFPLVANVIDDTTIEISYKGKGPFLKEYLVFPIVKKGSIFSNMPLGTGPYMFDSYEKKKEIFLVAYENYHDEKPSIARIRGIVHDDKDLIYTSLETGRIHVSTAWGQNFYRFFNNEYFHAKTYPSNEMYFLFLNPSGVLGNRDFRKAIKNSIDKDRIIKVALDDQGVKTTGFMNPNSYFYRNEQDMTNIDRAKEIVGNEKLIVNLYFYWKNSYQVKIATLIAESLNSIGIKVNLVGNSNEDFSTYTANLKEGNYDIALCSMSVNVIPDYCFIINSGIFPYISEDIKIFNDQILETNDEQELITVTNNIDLKLNEENIFIPLVYKMNALIYSNSIVGEIKPNLIFPYMSLRSAYFTSKEIEKNEKSIDK